MMTVHVTVKKIVKNPTYPACLILGEKTGWRTSGYSCLGCPPRLYYWEGAAVLSCLFPLLFY